MREGKSSPGGTGRHATLATLSAAEALLMLLWRATGVGYRRIEA